MMLIARTISFLLFTLLPLSGSFSFSTTFNINSVDIALHDAYCNLKLASPFRVDCENDVTYVNISKLNN